ncbi:hypothetical protein LguiA_017786 [Lonicera macranthoides]
MVNIVNNNGALVVLSSLLLLAIAALPHCHAAERFIIEGKIYCDTCRVQFETRISEPLEGAEVELRCRCGESNKEKITVRTKSDKDGKYVLSVEGDYEKDICEVTTISSPRPDCSEPMDEHARVVCTKNMGIVNDRRYANPIGFIKSEALPECQQVLDEMGYIPIHE